MAGTVFTAATNVTLTNGGLTASITSGGGGGITQSTDFKNSGKLALEFTLDATAASSACVGLAKSGATNIGLSAGGGWTVKVNLSLGNVYLNGATSTIGAIGALAVGDKVSIEIDFATHFVSVRKNGGTALSGYLTDPSAYLSPAFMSSTGASNAQQVTMNSGNTAFTYAPSSGYTAGWPANITATTLNPSDKDADIVLSNGNLSATMTVPTTQEDVNANVALSSGKWVFGVKVDSFTNGAAGLWAGIRSSSASAAWQGIGQTSNSWVSRFINGSETSLGNVGGTGWNAVGREVMVAVDLTAKLFWIKVAGENWNNNASANPATGTGGYDFSACGAGPYYPFVTLGNNSQAITVNFGASAFGNTIPSGFAAWDSALPGTTLLTSQVGSEVFVSGGTSDLYVSQIGVEVWRASADNFASALMVSQIGLEIWRSTEDLATAVNASGSQTLPAFTQAGTGTVVVSGSGAQTFAVSGAGTGSVRVTGSGAQSVPITGTGTGTVVPSEVNASGNQTLTITSAGTGSVPSGASGSQTLVIASAAVGDVDIKIRGNQFLGPLFVFGDPPGEGTVVVEGSGSSDVTFTWTLVGGAVAQAHGSSEFLIDWDGLGKVIVTATGTSVLALTGSGTGTVENRLSASQNLNLTSTGAGQVWIAAQAAQSLDFTQTAEGHVWGKGGRPVELDGHSHPIDLNGTSRAPNLWGTSRKPRI